MRRFIVCERISGGAAVTGFLLEVDTPGNSGGPLLDASGHIVEIVTAKLDATLVARYFDIPQNVNFALKAEVARTFLDSKGISYQSAHSDVQLPPADVGDIARPFTVEIECYAAPSESMADTSRKAYEASQPPEPPATPPPAPVAQEPQHTDPGAKRQFRVVSDDGYLNIQRARGPSMM